MVVMLSIKRIKTNDPDRETWRYLQFFSSESYVAKLVKEETVQKQIVSCVRQAAEIYALSKEATLLTKPILLFYGMQRLAKALIFLKNPDVNPNDLKRHGLSGKGISDKPERFFKNRIQKTKKGIFPEFSRWTTKNNILLGMKIYEKEGYHFLREWIERFDISDFINASEFVIYDLFSLVPELVDLFSFLKMRNDLLIPCHMDILRNIYGKFNCILDIRKQIDIDLLKTRFPEFDKFDRHTETQHRLIFDNRNKDELELPSPFVQAYSKDLYLVVSTGNSSKISEMNVHFILMFLLCYVARYKAPLLEAIVEGYEEGKHVTLIEKFIEISETKFPKLILDELLNKYFLFIKS
jgi:hypothetical protein